MRSETEESDVSSASSAEELGTSRYAQEHSRGSRPKSINTWQKLIAILVTSGINRLTLAQYSLVRNTVNWVIEQYAPHESLLPSYSTVQITLLPNLRANDFPRSEKHFLPVDLRKAGAKRTTLDNKIVDQNLSQTTETSPREGSTPKAEVEVIIPSTWAAQDVSFKPTWEIMRSGSLSESGSGLSNPVFSSASSISIVSDRKTFLDEPHHGVFSQSTDAGPAACFLSQGETVRIVLETEPVPKEWTGIGSKVPQDYVRSISTTQCSNSEFHLTAVLGETKLSTTDMIPSLHSKHCIGRAGDILTTVSVSEITLYECLIIHRFGGFCRSGNMIELACHDPLGP